jgi:hypothetical protein
MTKRTTDYTNLTSLPPYVTLPEEWEPRMGYPTNVPEGGAAWSKQVPPPHIGQQVNVTDSNLGRGYVTGYCIEEGLLGCYVQITNAPDWWLKCNGSDTAIVYGPSLEY